MTLLIRGRRFKLIFGNPGGDDWGKCHYDTQKIVVRGTLSPLNKLDTVIHELLHAAVPDMDETAVDETASAIAKALWRLGYRPDDGD